MTRRFTSAGCSAIHTARSVTTEESTIAAIPTGPSAQARAAPGNPEKNRATPATIPAQVPATAMGTTASQGSAVARATAIVPKIVTGATKGPATTLAIRANVVNCG